MKITIIIANISLSFGTERAVCNLANLLSETHQVQIVSIDSFPEQTSGFYLNSKVEIFHLGILPAENFIQKIYRNIRILFQLRKFAACNMPDIILGTKGLINFLLCILLGKSPKTACEHFSYNSSPFLSKVLRHIFYPRLDAVVLLTHHDAEHYTFVLEKKRFVIPNSLSFSCDTPSDCENKRIITMGRFVPQKGYDYLLQTAVKLKQEIPDWHIDIFGSGDDEEMLKELAKKLQVDDFVSFHPPTKEVTKELCSSGMYVMSSRFEGLPMVLLEAQECGLPIVSFDCPEGPSEVIHDGEDGFLVPLADTDALAEKIITLAKNEEMRKEFGRNAKINCKQFSPERVGEMWMDLIHKLTVNKDI